MKPRLETSKKWTHFPKEFAEQIQSVFSEAFSSQLEGQKIRIEGRIYPEELVLRVGLHQEGRLRQANFEVSANFNADEEQVLESIHNMVDVAASMMTEYFESQGEVEFPLYWKDYPFKGKTIFLQFSSENTDLEAQADALLGEDSTAMLNESESDEDADPVDKTHLH